MTFGSDITATDTPAMQEPGLMVLRKGFAKVLTVNEEGYLGRYLILLPEENLVVVRMIHWRDGYDEKRDGFSEILELAPKLVRTSSAQ